MSMKMKIQLTIEPERGEVLSTQEVAELERTDLQIETVGLTLAEAKTVLHKVQETLVAQQVAEYTARQRPFPSCHRGRSSKGHHRITFRTLFGKLALDSVRFYRCPCEGQGSSSVRAKVGWPSAPAGATSAMAAANSPMLRSGPPHSST